MFCFFYFYYEYKSSYISAEEERRPKFWLLFASKFLKNSIYLVDIFCYEYYNNITKRFPNVTKEKKK